MSSATQQQKQQHQENKQSHSLTYLRPEVAALKKRLDQFVEEECIPAEEEYDAHIRARVGDDRWTLDAIPSCVEKLKRRAQILGLWNLFIPPHLISHFPTFIDAKWRPSIPLSYREYGILCESLGRCPHLAPQVCNTSAPDTGNMEVLLEFGTPQQQKEYLLPLLRGEIRSTFLMTEPEVASSDPTNLQTKLWKKKKTNQRKESSGTLSSSSSMMEEYVLSGRKWWSTGAMDPRCRMALVVARMEYEGEEDDNHDDDDEEETNNKKNNKHGAHTIVLVPMPQKGVILQRPLKLFGYDDAPSGHAEVVLDSISLNSTHLISVEGSGFRVSQARLGPGRIHHCMRAIGMGTFDERRFV